MNVLLHWLTAPEWVQMVKALLHTLWQAVLIAALLGLALRRSVRPTTRYYLSLASLAAVVAAGILTWALFTRGQPNGDPSGLNAEAADTTLISQPMEVAGDPAAVVVATGTAAPLSPEPSRWTAWLALVWVAGAGLMLLRAGIQVAGAERLRRSGRPLENPDVAKLLVEARKALRLAREVRVAVTDRLTSPAVVGVLVPTLILPLSLLTTLTPDQIRFILLHELAHIRRGDYLANLFQLFAEALLFFNPAVWWISHQVRREREACCDALAIELCRAPADYAKTLVRVAENVLYPPAAAPAFGGRSKGTSSLNDRVQRLLVPGYRPALRLTWRAMLTALLLGGALLVFSAVGTRLTVAAIDQKVKTKPPGSELPDDKQPVPDEKLLQIAKLDSRPASETNSVAIAPTGPTLVRASTNRLEILRKLRTIRLDFVADGEPLSQVIPKLADQAKEADPEKTGVNLSIQASANHPRTIVAPMIDPATGMPYRDTIPGDSFDVEQLLVKLDVRNCSLAAILDAIVSSTNRLKYSILENGIAFSQKSPDEPPTLHIRKFRVGTNFFSSVLRNETGQTGSDSQQDYHKALFKLMSCFGVELQPETGRNIFANLQENTLMVRATPSELDQVETIVSTYDSGPDAVLLPRTKPEAGVAAVNEPLEMRQFLFNLPAFLIETGLTNVASQHAELRQALNRFFSAAGADMEPPRNFFLSHLLNDPIMLVKATHAELERIERAVIHLNSSDSAATIPASAKKIELASASAEPTAPKGTNELPWINLKTRFTEVPDKVVETIRRKWPSTQTTTNGVRFVSLNADQTQELLKEIKQSDKKPMGVSNVTTKSGLRGQIQIGEIISVLLGINPAALTPPGVEQTLKTNALMETRQMFFGQVANFVPFLSADRRSVQLTVTPHLSEFLGYDKPSGKTVVYVNGTKSKTPDPRPRYRKRETSVQVQLEIGSTLLLEGFVPEETFKDKDGKVQTRNVVSDSKRQLLILVTPSLVASGTHIEINAP